LSEQPPRLPFRTRAANRDERRVGGHQFRRLSLSFVRPRMPNPPKSVSDLKKLISTARAIVTYQVGLPFGCIRVRRILSDLRAQGLVYPVFDEYLQALKELPMGSEHLKWNRDALRERDVKLEAESRRFRDAIFEACYEIIDAHGNNSNDNAA
jgi:hypothetical protein